MDISSSGLGTKVNNKIILEQKMLPAPLSPRKLQGFINTDSETGVEKYVYILFLIISQYHTSLRIVKAHLINSKAT